VDAFRTFLVHHNVISTAAGMSFAVSTVALIKSFVGDVCIPGIFQSVRAFPAPTGRLESILNGAFKEGTELRLTSFVAELLTYFLVLLCAFLLLEYVFNRMVVPDKVVAAVDKEREAREEEDRRERDAQAAAQEDPWRMVWDAGAPKP
jgi:large-conductance mechanosensitive channel